MGHLAEKIYRHPRNLHFAFGAKFVRYWQQQCRCSSFSDHQGGLLLSQLRQTRRPGRFCYKKTIDDSTESPPDEKSIFYWEQSNGKIDGRATLERTFKRAYHLNANFSLAEIKSSQSLLRARTYNFTRRCGAWREKTPLAMNQISHLLCEVGSI